MVPMHHAVSVLLHFKKVQGPFICRKYRISRLLNEWAAVLVQTRHAELLDANLALDLEVFLWATA